MQGFLLGSISNRLTATSKMKDVQPGGTRLLAVYIETQH